MCQYLITFEEYLKIFQNIYKGFFAPKSVDYIFLTDIIDAFFCFLIRCHGPPFINLMKKIKLIGGINNGKYA